MDAQDLEWVPELLRALDERLERTQGYLLAPGPHGPASALGVLTELRAAVRTALELL